MSRSCRSGCKCELSVQFNACAFSLEELLVSFLNLCLDCSNQLVQTFSAKVAHASTSVTGYGWAGYDSSSTESSPQGEGSRGGIQVFWAPNMVLHIRVDLATGVPEYSNYLKSRSWLPRRALPIVGDDGIVIYSQVGDRIWPSGTPAASIKLKPSATSRTTGRCSILSTWRDSCNKHPGWPTGVSVTRQGLRRQPPRNSHSSAATGLEV